MGGPGGSDRRDGGHGLSSQSEAGEMGATDRQCGSSFMKLGSEGAEDKVGDEQRWIEGEFFIVCFLSFSVSFFKTYVRYRINLNTNGSHAIETRVG